LGRGLLQLLPAGGPIDAMLSGPPNPRLRRRTLKLGGAPVNYAVLSDAAAMVGMNRRFHRRERSVHMRWTVAQRQQVACREEQSIRHR
jgi:hypothetical protein